MKPDLTPRFGTRWQPSEFWRCCVALTDGGIWVLNAFRRPHPDSRNRNLSFKAMKPIEPTISRQAWPLDTPCANCGREYGHHSSDSQHCPTGNPSYFKPIAVDPISKPKSNLQFRVYFHGLTREIVECAGQPILKTPINLLRNHMANVAEEARRINDERLNGLMCMMGLYAQSDPEDEAFDAKLTERTIDRYLSLKASGEIPSQPELTPHQVLEQLRKMDPWRRWYIAREIVCDPGLDEDSPKLMDNHNIFCQPPYRSASEWEKDKGVQGFVSATSFEECLSFARAAFSQDLDAQIKVLTGDRMKTREDLPVLREVMSDLPISDLRSRVSEIIEGIESQHDPEAAARDAKRAADEQAAKDNR